MLQETEKKQNLDVGIDLQDILSTYKVGTSKTIGQNMFS